jgi:transposase
MRMVKRILAVLSVSNRIPYRVIAKTLKVSEEAIRLWVNALLLKGIEGLISNKGSGRPPKLAKTQKKELANFITQGPAEAGFHADCNVIKGLWMKSSDSCKFR